MTKPDFSDVTESKRRLMARVKGKNTAPELAVRKIAYGLGYRYRLHARRLPGTPDIVFRGLKKAIFVHGCFWHRHPGCRLTTTPKTRADYWNEKFDQNTRRDAARIQELEVAGWSTLVVWECETKDGGTLTRRLADFLAVSPSV